MVNEVAMFLYHCTYLLPQPLLPLLFLPPPLPLLLPLLFLLSYHTLLCYMSTFLVIFVLLMCLFQQYKALVYMAAILYTVIIVMASASISKIFH